MFAWSNIFAGSTFFPPFPENLIWRRRACKVTCLLQSDFFNEFYILENVYIF